MGIDDRDDDYRSRGQAPRRRGSFESSEPPAGRSQYRGARDETPRGRPRGADDQLSSRGPARRDYARDDDPRSSSGSRYQRGGPDRSGGYDRRPHSDQSGAGRRPRGDWEDDPTQRRERRPADEYARGERPARGPRPPMRDAGDTSARARGAPRGAGPGGSSGRNGRGGAAVAQSRGGLWADEPLRATGLRPGMAGARDPRAARRGNAAAEEDTSSAGAAFGKALLAIIMGLVIGAGAAYGYYTYSTPKIPASVIQPSTTPASGSSGSLGAGDIVRAHYAPVDASGGSPVTFVAIGASANV